MIANALATEGPEGCTGYQLSRDRIMALLSGRED